MKWYIYLAIFVALTGGLGAVHVLLEKKAVSAATNAIELKYKDQLVQALNAKAKSESDLNAYKAQADKDKQDALTKVSASLTATISSLQQRPTRSDLNSAVASAVASAKQACTGAELFREDAEFLAREAARADAVIVERDYYYGQYEHAREVLSGQESDAGLNGPVSNTKSVS
jgi:hypothetical protein